jgi:hypothetical protein
MAICWWWREGHCCTQILPKVGVRPVVLLVVAVDAEVLLKGTIDAFDLTVGRGAMARGEMKMHAKK